MAIGHLEFLAVMDVTTTPYKVYSAIPVDIPLNHKVLGTVAYYNDTDAARTMTCKVVFVDPRGYPKPSIAKSYTRSVSPGGHLTAATDIITLNQTGTWKIMATLDGLVDIKYWTVIRVPEEPEPPPVGWQLLDTKTFTIQPSVVPGWKLLDTKTFTIQPTAIGEWELLETKTATITPAGVIPPVTCTVDADCPPNEVCKDGVCVCAEGYERNKEGVCVKKEVPPTGLWLLAALAAGALILAPPPKEEVKKKKVK